MRLLRDSFGGFDGRPWPSWPQLFEAAAFHLAGQLPLAIMKELASKSQCSEFRVQGWNVRLPCYRIEFLQSCNMGWLVGKGSSPHIPDSSFMSRRCRSLHERNMRTVLAPVWLHQYALEYFLTSSLCLILRVGVHLAQHFEKQRAAGWVMSCFVGCSCDSQGQ